MCAFQTVSKPEMQLRLKHSQIQCSTNSKLETISDYIKSCASLEVCRLIIATFDSKGFGKINFKEFKDLICSIKFWQSAFKTHTKEKTGILKAERLREALLDVGFQLNSSVMGSIVSKYIRKDGTLRFGDFVGAILNLSIAFSGSKDKNLMSHDQIKPSILFQAPFEEKIKTNLAPCG